MSFYRVQMGHHLKYNVRMCYGCNKPQPREKGPASKKWRCRECRDRAIHAKAEAKE